MRVSAMLCDKATVREGLLHVLGGGITVLGRELPAPLAVDLAILLHPETLEEFNTTQEFSFSILSPSGGNIVSGEFGWESNKATLSDRPVPAIPIALDIGSIGIEESGDYQAQITLNGEVIFELLFRVVDADAEEIEDATEAFRFS